MGAWTALFNGTNNATYVEENSWVEGETNADTAGYGVTYAKGVYSTTVAGISAASSFRNTSTADGADSISSVGNIAGSPSNVSTGAIYTRAYYYIPSSTLNAQYLMLDWSDSYIDFFSAQTLAGIFIDSGGTLYAGQSNTSLTVDNTSSGAIPFGAWFRLEVYMNAGVCTTVRIFKGANLNGTTPDVTLSTSGGYYNVQADASDGVYGGQVNRELGFMAVDQSSDVGFGYMPLINDSALGYNYYMSAVDLSTSTWVGAYSSGGTSASVTQVAATVTATGGTQTVAAKRVAAVTQVAGTVTASGGTQAIATVNIASVTQSAANVTASGGTQVITTGSVVNGTVTQVAATVTASGGTQAVTSSQIASVSQSAATVTASGGTQSLAGVQIATIAQAYASITAQGGTQTVLGTSPAAYTLPAEPLYFEVGGGLSLPLGNSAGQIAYSSAAPTGTPSGYLSVYDYTHDVLYVYNVHSSSWKSVALT